MPALKWCPHQVLKATGAHELILLQINYILIWDLDIFQRFYVWNCFNIFLAETTTEEALISFGSKIPAETPTVTVTPETLPELTTIPFADEIVTKSTTVTPSPQGDLENELFDPTQAPDELEDDLFDTTIMPDLSKSTTEKTMPDGKFWDKKKISSKYPLDGQVRTCVLRNFGNWAGFL